MVLINNITDPDIASCIGNSTYNDSRVLLQVNGTVVKPYDIFKAYDDDTGCRFIRSCMMFTIYMGCLPKTSEYSSGCFDYMSRQSFMKLVNNEIDNEFYMSEINGPLNQFCMVIGSRIMTPSDLNNLYDSEPCKYVKYLDMMEPYNDSRVRQCLTIEDIVGVKKTILY